MTLRELKLLTQQLPDDALVLVEVEGVSLMGLTIIQQKDEIKIDHTESDGVTYDLCIIRVN